MMKASLVVAIGSVFRIISPTFYAMILLLVYLLRFYKVGVKRAKK